MDRQFITVSVRLSRAEYEALQAMAQETYNTMSGVIRRLIGRETERRAEHGESNEQAEQSA